ncbi:hypothetical protein D3C87_1865040 [compost metagenome]
MVQPQSGRYLNTKAQITKGIHINASVFCCIRRLKNELVLFKPALLDIGGGLKVVVGFSILSLSLLHLHAG